jgi:hypothetical protein
MPTEFWMVIGLLAVVAIASLYTGWKFGAEHAAHRITDDLREEALQKFRAEILPRFMDKYNEQIIKEATNIAAKLCEKYEEKINALVGEDKAVEVFKEIHDEIEKEIDNEDTHSS